MNGNCFGDGRGLRHNQAMNPLAAAARRPRVMAGVIAAGRGFQ